MAALQVLFGFVIATTSVTYVIGLAVVALHGGAS